MEDYRFYRFNNINFPDYIVKRLLDCPVNEYIEDNEGISKIDLNLMQKRADIWNRYAEEEGFLKIGSVYTYDRNDLGPLYVVTDVIPKECKGKNGYTCPKYSHNEYVTVQFGAVDDIKDFVDNGILGWAHPSPGLHLQKIEAIADDFRTFYTQQEKRNDELSALLKDTIAVCHDGHADYKNYYLMKISHVKYDYVSGHFLAYPDENGMHWLHIKCSDGTYTYQTWKEETVDNRPFYVHTGSSGYLMVKSVHYNFFSAGFFIDLQKSCKDCKTWELILKKFKACNGVNEREQWDPFSDVYDECARKLIEYDIFG